MKIIQKYLYNLFLYITLFFVYENTYCTSMPLHDIHISICKINYNNKSKSLELSFRFFTDDIEKAIKKYNGENIISIEGQKTQQADKYILNYILSKFSIESSNNEINYDFIGWEIKETVIWCYIEIKNINLANNFLIKNKLLFELFSDQKNIVTLVKENSKKSFIFNKKNYLTNLSTKNYFNIYDR